MTWVLVRFVLIGPALGTLGFVFADQVLQISSLGTSTLAQTSSASQLPGAVGVLWFYGLLLAYPFGAIPALLTGALFAQVLRRRHENPSAPIRAALGATLGACIAVTFGLLFIQSYALPSLLRWATAGALGGAVSGSAITIHVFSQLSLLASPPDAA